MSTHLPAHERMAEDTAPALTITVTRRHLLIAARCTGALILMTGALMLGMRWESGPLGR